MIRSWWLGNWIIIDPEIILSSVGFIYWFVNFVVGYVTSVLIRLYKLTSLKSMLFQRFYCSTFSYTIVNMYFNNFTDCKGIIIKERLIWTVYIICQISHCIQILYYHIPRAGNLTTYLVSTSLKYRLYNDNSSLEVI